MQVFRSQSLRLPIVALTALGWLTLSNHCAIAALGNPRDVQPRPSCHHSPAKQDAPAKEKRCDFECCKLLRAMPTKSAGKVSASYHIQFANFAYSVAQSAFEILLRATLPLELNTGPPLVPSFAESVLQRSILAHAPPLFA